MQPNVSGQRDFFLLPTFSEPRGKYSSECIPSPMPGRAQESVYSPPSARRAARQEPLPECVGVKVRTLGIRRLGGSVKHTSKKTTLASPTPAAGWKPIRNTFLMRGPCGKRLSRRRSESCFVGLWQQLTPSLPCVEIIHIWTIGARGVIYQSHRPL